MGVLLLDPYYVKMGQNALNTTVLIASGDPSQTMLSGISGFMDGIKVDLTLYSVFMTAYISYKPPSQTVSQMTIAPAPNATDNDVMDCTVINFSYHDSLF